MARIVIQHLLLFLLPFILYGVYMAVMRQRARTKGLDQPAWEDGPYFWLAVGGLVLTLGAFAFLGFSGGYEPDTDYTPSRIEGGKVVPGETK